MTIRKRAVRGGEPRSAGWTGRFALTKFDTESGVAFGWASFSKDKSGNLIIDHDDDVIRPHELERAAYRHTESAGTANVMHVGPDIGVLVESVYMDTAKRKAMGLGSAEDDSAAWWVGYRITDPAVRAQVAAGAFPEFSIEGWADRVPTGAGAFELKNLEVEKVAFVDKGAGIGVQVALYKVRASGEVKVNKYLKRLEKALKRLSAEKSALVSKALEGEAIGAMALLEVIQKMASMEDIKAKLTAEEWDLILAHLAPPAADPAAAAADASEDAADANGAMPEAAMKALEKHRTEFAKVQAELEELKKAQKFEKYRAEAAAKFQFVPGKPEDIAKSLQLADEHPDRTFGKALRDQLVATNESLRQSDLLKTFGSTRKGKDEDGNISKSAGEKILEVAKAQVAKGEGGANIGKAVLKAAESNPDLYREYYQERRRRSGALGD